MSDAEYFLSKTDIKANHQDNFIFNHPKKRALKGLRSKEKEQVRNLLRFSSRGASWK